MISEIMAEIKYLFGMVVIIALGMCFCDWGNKEAALEAWYQGYEYNLNPSEGTGWIDSIVTKGVK